MYSDKNIPEQILNGFVWAAIIIFSPIILSYKLLRLFTIACLKETGNKLVKIFGGTFAVTLILLLAQIITEV